MLQNILANFIGRFWSILSNFIFLPLYIHFLGFENYSIISFTLVLAGIMSILDLGLTSTLSREFARVDISLNEKFSIFRTLETCYILLITICILFFLFLSNKISNNWINLNPLYQKKISLLLKIVIIEIGFQLLLRFYLGGMFGLGKQIKSNIYQIIWGVSRNGLVLLPLFYYPTLNTFFFWQIISTIIFTFLVRRSLYYFLTDDFKISFKILIDRVIFKRIWRFAGGMFLISLVAALNTQMDKILISKFLPIEVLGFYTISVSLAMGIVVLINPISISILPKFTSLFSSGKTDELNLLYKKSSFYISIIVFAIFANMLFFSKKIIWIWTGDLNIADGSFIYLPIISLSAVMISLTSIPYNVAIAYGYTKINNILGLSSLVITIPGYLFAAKYYNAIGVAIVFCTIQTVTTLLYIFLINKKFFKFENVYKIYIEQILKPLIISILIVFFFSNIPSFIESSRIISLMWIALTFFITIFISFLILADKKEIKFILLNLKKLTSE